MGGKITNKKRKVKFINNVYLIPHNDGTYEATVSAVTPPGFAALLTAEGEYPVKYYYHRMDANGDGILEVEVCANREELIAALNYNGTALHTIRALWNFDSHEYLPMDVRAVFYAAQNAWAILSAEDDACCPMGYEIGTPTVKELIAILSKLPEDYRVTCCGADGFIHLFDDDKYITIDTERFLT